MPSNVDGNTGNNFLGMRWVRQRHYWIYIKQYKNNFETIILCLMSLLYVPRHRLVAVVVVLLTLILSLSALSDRNFVTTQTLPDKKSDWLNVITETPSHFSRKILQLFWLIFNVVLGLLYIYTYYLYPNWYFPRCAIKYKIKC